MTLASTTPPLHTAVKRAIADTLSSPDIELQGVAKRARTGSITSARMSISYLLNEPTAGGAPTSPAMSCATSGAADRPGPQILALCSNLLFLAESPSPSTFSPCQRSSQSCSMDDASSEVSADAPALRECETSIPAPAPKVPASPFECEICHKCFRERGNLTKHRNSVHSSAPRPFACQVDGCSKSFSFRDGLNRHTQTVHNCVRPYACPVDGCDKRFKQRSHAAKHVKTCHREDA